MKKMVLGIGNVLLSDEGFGVHVVRNLQEEKLPEDTEIFDGGTASWYALPSIEEIEKLIVVDVVKHGEKPGTIYEMRTDAHQPVSFTHKRESIVSLHEIGLFESLSWLRTRPEEIVIFGIEPARIEWGMELSRELNSKVSVVTRLIQAELKAC